MDAQKPVSLWNVADLDTRTKNYIEGDDISSFFKLLPSRLTAQVAINYFTDGLADSIPTFGCW